MTSKLTKKELVEKIGAITDLPKTKSEEVLNTISRIIIAELQFGNEVELPGIGKFSKSYREPRTGVNLQTKEKVTYPGRNVPKFKASKNFKEAMEVEITTI